MLRGVQLIWILRCVLGMMTFLILPYSFLMAQEDEQGRLTLTLNIGSTLAGESNAEDVEQAFIRAGLNETEPGLCFFGCTEPQRHPFSHFDDAPSYAIQLDYSLTAKVSLGVAYTYIDGIQTNGFKASLDSGFLPPGLDVELFYREINNISFLLKVVSEKKGFVRLKAQIGPALNFIQSSMQYELYDNNDRIVDENATKLGINSALGMEFPVLDLFFFDFNFRYNLMGKSEIGPYNLSGNGDTTTLESFEINNNTWMIMGGVGYRF